MIAATITVNAPSEKVDIRNDGPVLRAAFGDAAKKCRFSLIEAPGGRGTEIHASSEELHQKEVKVALRRYRALLETGEMPTGARKR